MAKCKELSSILKTSEGNMKIRGTQFYNAPEIIKKKEPSPKSDVWSTACTLVELYTERSCWKFKESDIVKDDVDILQGKSPPVNGVPMFIRKILAQGFKHDPEKRCNIGEILLVLEDQLNL